MLLFFEIEKWNISIPVEIRWLFCFSRTFRYGSRLEHLFDFSSTECFRKIQLYALSLSQTSNYFLSVCIFLFCPVIIHQVIDYFAQCEFFSNIERCSAAMPTIMSVIRFQLICLYCLFHFVITNLSLIIVLSIERM